MTGSPSFRRVYVASSYTDARDKALEDGKIPHGFLDLHEAGHIMVKNWIIYLGWDDDCGGLITIDGFRIEVMGLWNAGPKGQGEHLLSYLVDRWDVNYLNAFEGRLTQLYARYGFKEIERYSFDPALAHEDWDYETYGTPDLLVMERN